MDPGRIELAKFTNGDLPFGIDVDAVYVYFSAIDTGIMRTPKVGGAIDLLAADDHGPHVIAASEESIFVCDLGTPNNNFADGRLARVSKSGGTLEILAHDIPSAGIVRVSGEYVYFTSMGTPMLGGGYLHDGAIYRVKKDGTGLLRLAKDQEVPGGMVVDDAYVYWVAEDFGSVRRCAIGGCAEKPTELYSNLNVPLSMAVDEAWLYWSSKDNNIVRAPKDGKGNIGELTGSRGLPKSIVVSRGELFWTDVYSHSVSRMPKDGSLLPKMIWQDPETDPMMPKSLPTVIAVDEASVYFTDQGWDDVVRIGR